jgi:hypothetical protein
VTFKLFLTLKAVLTPLKLLQQDGLNVSNFQSGRPSNVHDVTIHKKFVWEEFLMPSFLLLFQFML